MRKLEFRAIIIILLCAGLSVWSIQGTASRSIFEVSIDDYHLTAGIINTSKIDVTNIGDSAKDVEAQLTSNTPFITVLEGFSSFLRDIDKGETEYFVASLSVSQGTPLGSYTLSLVLTYENEIGSLSVANYVLGVLVDSVEDVRIKFDVSFQNYELVAGTQNLGVVSIRNLSPYRVNNIEAQLVSQTPYIVILEDSYQFFESIDSETSVNFTTLLAVSRNTPLGPYNFALNLQYQLNAEIKSSSYNLGCVVNSSEPSKIQILSMVRENDDYILTIENIGNETIKNIFTSITNNGVLVGSPFEIYLQELLPSNPTQLQFQILNDISFVEITFTYDSSSQMSILQIPAQTGNSLVMTSVFASQKGDVGTTVFFDLTLRNRGFETFYYLDIIGLPDPFTYRFVSGGSEVAGLQLKEAQIETVFLEINIPTFPRGFISDKPQLFSVISIDSDTYVNILNEPRSTWLSSSTSTVELVLTPTIHDILQINGDSWNNDLVTSTSDLHIPGIPYLINDLSLGSYISPKFELKGNTTYIISLFGNYVGSDVDLNLHLFNSSGFLLNSSYSAQGISDILDIHLEFTDVYFVVITYDESPSKQISSAILLIAENWGLNQSSQNYVQLNERHYPYFLLSEVHAYWVDVSNVQGQDMTIQVEWTPSLGADLRIYPFTRNSQKTEYDPLDPSNPPVLTLARSNLPQSQNSTYQIARDVERLLLVTTNVQGSGNLSIQLSYSNPRIDFWSYSSHRKEILGSIMILSIIGLFVLAYFGEKYLR